MLHGEYERSGHNNTIFNSPVNNSVIEDTDLHFHQGHLAIKEESSDEDVVFEDFVVKRKSLTRSQTSNLRGGGDSEQEKGRKEVNLLKVQCRCLYSLLLHHLDNQRHLFYDHVCHHKMSNIVNIASSKLEESLTPLSQRALMNASL